MIFSLNHSNIDNHQIADFVGWYDRYTKPEWYDVTYHPRHADYAILLQPQFLL